MMIPRQPPGSTLCIGLLLACLGAVSPDAAGRLTLVAPAAPGGGWDQTARLLQQALISVEPDLAVQVENVPGAAGTIGLARFVTSERGNPDALMVTGLVMVSAIVTNGSPVTLAATTPIARLTGEYEVIAVPVASPFTTIGQLLEAFRRAPASVSWAGGSAGGTDDLLVRLIAEAIGVPPAAANYIAFPGGGAALAALLGGQVTAGVSGYAEFAGQLGAGQLRALALSAPSRVPGIEVPTLRESGIDLDLANWRGLVAPPGLSPAEREALSARVERVARSPAWQTTVRRNNWTDLLLTGPAFRQFLVTEQARVEAVLRRLGRRGGPVAEQLTLSPSSVPLAVVLVLGLLLTTAGVGALRGAHAGTGRSRAASPAAWMASAGLLGALLLQAALVERAGFVLTSVGVYMCGARALGSRRWRRDFAAGLTICVLLYLVFTSGLGLALPPTPGFAGRL